MGVLPGAARFVFSAPKWQGGQNYTTAIPTESGAVGDGWRDSETLAFLSILKTKSHATKRVNQGTDFSCLTWGSPRGTVVILNGEQALFSEETHCQIAEGIYRQQGDENDVPSNPNCPGPHGAERR